MRKFVGLFLFFFLLAPLYIYGQNHSGTYFRRGDGGQVKITQARKSAIKFSLTVFTKKDASCAGKLSGNAEFVSQNTFEYRGNSNNKESKGCHLTFVFSGKTLTIRETNCGDFHGDACSFEGAYRKH